MAKAKLKKIADEKARSKGRIKIFSKNAIQEESSEAEVTHKEFSEESEDELEKKL